MDLTIFDYTIYICEMKMFIVIPETYCIMCRLTGGDTERGR